MSRKAKKFYANRGYLTAEGNSKTEAKANLEPMIDWACAHASPTIEMRFGLLIVIASNPQGFESRVINPAHLEHGKQYHSCCCYGQIDYGTVLQSARNHAAQNAWHHGINDDSGFVDQAGLTKDGATDLARWIAWQRRYRELKLSGHTDSEAHELASGIRRAA